MAAARAGSGTGPERSRTVSWENPLPGARSASSMSGLDYMLAIKDGDGRLVAHATTTCLVTPPPREAPRDEPAGGVNDALLDFLAD
jgi:hypothetical protein